MTAARVVVPRAHNEVPAGLFAHIVNSCHQQAQHVNVYPVRRHAVAIVDNGINDKSNRHTKLFINLRGHIQDKYHIRMFMVGS
jgi:hypothetical protein